MAKWIYHIRSDNDRSNSECGKLNLTNTNRNSKERRRTAVTETVINLVSGFSGGTANVLIGQPFDTAKTKMQIYPDFYKGMWDSLKQSWVQEKFKGIYSGLLPNLMVNVVEASVIFVVYPWLQTKLARHKGCKVEDLTTFQKACLGSAASIVSASAMTPFEVIKCRLQVSRENWFLHHKGYILPTMEDAVTPSILKIYREIKKREGRRALFKGIHCAILRDIIGYFFYIGTYELCLETLCPVCTRGAGYPMPVIMISGGLAGVMHYVTCFPIDVVKARIQNQSYHVTARSVMLNILRNEGKAYFWSGMKPVIIRTIPGSAVFFLVYENVRKQLRTRFIPHSEEAQCAAEKREGGGEGGKCGGGAPPPPPPNW